MASSRLEERRRRSDSVRKNYWVLSLLYSRRDEQASSLYSIARGVERKTGTTVRDQDIRVIVDGLVAKGMVIRRSSANPDCGYHISDHGIEWWEKYGAALREIM